MTTDVKLKCENDVYDLFLDQNGDLTNGDFFDSSLEYAIFGERRASESEVPESSLRRGWIGNEGKNFENGSKIWLFDQERMTRNVMNELQDTALDAVEYFIEDGLVKDIKTRTVISEGFVALEISIQRFDSTVEKRYYNLWENTGVQNAT